MACLSTHTLYYQISHLFLGYHRGTISHPSLDNSVTFQSILETLKIKILKLSDHDK